MAGEESRTGAGARGSICSRGSRFALRAIRLRPPRIISSWNNRRVLRNAWVAYNKVEERSRSVGCAITFHRASVIAGPRVRARKNKKGRKKGKREAGSILYVPVSFESYVKRKRGFRDVNSQPGARRVVASWSGGRYRSRKGRTKE